MNLTQQKNDDKQIVLTNYARLGAAKTEQAKRAVLDEIFADDAYTLVNTADVYTLVEWGDKSSFLSNCRDEFKARIYNIIKNRDIEIVELSWFYRKQNYKSKALVNGNGIIYDNIASFALDHDAVESVEATTVKAKRSSSDAIIDTLPENIRETRDGETFEVSDYSDGRMLITGKSAWKYRIRLISVFDKNDVLCNASCNSYIESSTGWSCNAHAWRISGEINKSGFNEFSWGWEYGDARGASSTGSNGNKMHRP